MSGNQYSNEQDTERKILEAAAKVFIRKGKLGTSMQDIADEAKINRTLLHYYFRNKDKLFDKVFEKVVVRILPAMLGFMSVDKPLIERIRGFVEAYAGLLTENPYLPVFIFQEISLNPDRLAGMIRTMGVDAEKILRHLSDELEKSGMHGTDPRHILASMMGMVFFPYIGRPLFQALAFGNNSGEYDRFLEERIEEIPRFFRLALAGSKSKTTKS